ncbi:MAG: Na(+)-translocating NADH-quinone reductase subunit A [Pseudomonadota bacterium]
MRRFSLRKGLNVPILGAPKPGVEPGPAVRTVGLLGADYLGLKPRLSVAEGDLVGPGMPIFNDKDLPSVQVVSPVSGRVRAINRGARRVLASVEIDVLEDGPEAVDFSGLGDAETADGLVERLCAAGLWTAFRTRPYSRVPQPETRPAAIYVAAMDTEPLAADPDPIIRADAEAFRGGLNAVARLSEGKTYLCQGEGDPLPGSDLPGVEPVAFAGPHPAGLAGTHIHFLEPPGAAKIVWTIGYGDVIAIGKLLQTGRVDASCVIALSGPACLKPRLVRTIAGASMRDLTETDRPRDIPLRLISGSVLSGRAGEGNSAYLGRYARQITLIEEDRAQIPLGWIRPMPGKYAVQPVLGSAWRRKLFPLTSNLNGGRRAMVPLGTFEELMPQDYLPTQLLRALLVMDTDQAQALGALELDEEDLALVGFACPAKYEYGTALRDCLTRIEKEG